VIVIVLALAGVGSGAVLAQEPNALVSVSTLTVVDGAVLISHDGAEFTLANEGDVLIAGDTIRTGTDGAAELTYFEGSSVRLEADREMIVASLHASDAAGQVFGRAWHATTKLITGGSRYEERTPSSTASVRG
jgi:hypothetical protein